MATRYLSNGDDQFVLLPDLLGDTPDEVFGQDGNDTFYAYLGHGRDTVDGGAGDDLLVIDYSNNIYTGAYPAGITTNGYGDVTWINAWRESNSAGNFADTVYFKNVERLYVKGTYASDYIGGMIGNDTLFGYSGNDTLMGGAGNNTLDGGEGSDTITAGGTAGNGNDVINGGNGDDTITADGSWSTTRGNDVINAGAGNDTISDDGGILKIDGGEGIDTLTTEANFSSLTTRLSLNDRGVTQTTVSLADGTRVAGIEYLNRVVTGSGDDVIAYTTNRNQTIKTGAGNDTITAGVGRDWVDAGIGSDSLKANFSANSYAIGITMSIGGSASTGYGGYIAARRSVTYDIDEVQYTGVESFEVKGTNVADTLSGGDFNDRFIGNAGADTINAAGGSDYVDGGAGTDVITGGLGADMLLGGNDSDRLIGGADNDVLTGGGGADHFVFDTNSAFSTSVIGIDTIKDFSLSSDKITLDKTTFTALATVADGALPVATFAKVTNDAEVDINSALIVHNTATGAVFYNQNGASAGLGSGGQFATLTNLASLTAANFQVQV